MRSCVIFASTLIFFSACTERDAIFEEFNLRIRAEADEADAGEVQSAPIALLPIDRAELCTEKRDPCRADPCHEGVRCTAKSELEFDCGPCPEGMLGDGITCRRPRRIEINEVDYDQVGADDAEFIEIINRGEERAELEGLVIELFNGDNNEIYRRIPLGPLGALAPGEYAVIANTRLPLPEGVPNIRIGSSGFIQNGPDAILIVDEEGRQLDAMVYGGTLEGFDEGSHALDQDLGEGSLIRLEPGGRFFWTCLETPGEPNLERCGP